MRPAGFQLAFNIRIISKAFQHTVMCDRRFSVPFINRHLFPVCRMAADCTAHGSLVLFQIPMDNCPVLSGNGMYRELFCEALVGEIALTDNQGTRCVHIDSVDDSGAQNAVDAGEISATVIQNRIDQCSAAVACRRMYDHPLGLIDDQKIIILVQNIKRNVFWLHVQFFRFRQKHQNGITGGNLTACFLRFSVDRNLSVF